MPFEFHLDLRARAVSTLNALTHLGVAPAHDATLSVVRDFLNGTAANQCDCIYERRRSLASGAVDTIDINGLTNDVFGNNIPMLTLVGVVLINEDVGGIANTTNLTLGGGVNAIQNILGTTAATKIIRPGGVFLTLETSASGIATVTPGTADIITITNAAGATNNYQIILIGRTV